jgi:cytochrome c biogenesis protein CcdA
MIGLTLLVASIAIADAINPSTVVPALWLARNPRAHGLSSYVLGVFAVYLVGGLVLVFGPGPALIAALRHIRGPVEHVVLAVAGAVVLVFAVVLWRSRRNEQPARSTPRLRGRGSSLALGAGIMVVELPTAFVYFGAITAILAAHPGAAAKIALLFLYNALFVAPLAAIIVVRRLAGSHADEWLAAGERWLRRVGRVALSGVAGAGGAALMVIGVSGLVAA